MFLNAASYIFSLRKCGFPPLNFRLLFVPYSKYTLLLLLQCSLVPCSTTCAVSTNALLSSCSLLKSLNVAFLQHCFSYVLITHVVNTLSANRC